MFLVLVHLLLFISYIDQQDSLCDLLLFLLLYSFPLSSSVRGGGSGCPPSTDIGGTREQCLDLVWGEVRTPYTEGEEEEGEE